MSDKKTEIVTFKASKALRDHIHATSKKKDLSSGAWIRAVIKKHTGFKEPAIEV